ncbi:MAG: biotin/lipoyl-containing protein, partial [Longimicrobiales bacterium]|nr:biotin/lipoyl-containing protein [Longimicrobiales bacterium]
MATKVHMEALSPTMEEGQIVRWLKEEGDAVANGDILAEIETDKATMELVARGDGILRAILLPEGGTAPVGEVIGVIGAEGEDISALVKDAGAADGAAKDAGAEGPEAKESEERAAPSDAAPSEDAGDEGAGEAGAEAGEDGDAPAEAESPAGSGRVKASPLARRLAR